MCKIIYVLCSLLLLSTIVLADDTKLRIALITDATSIRDHSFNEATYNSLKNVQTKFPEIDIKVFECQKEQEYRSTVEQLSEGDYDLIISAGTFLHDIMREVAKEHKGIKYLVVNSPYPKGSYLPNLATISFNEIEISFLAGVLSGSLTSKYHTAIKGLNIDKKIGIIKGSDSSQSVNNFAAGFAKGVLKVCPDCSIQSNTLNSFSDKANANKIASQMYKEGVDIIYAIAGFASVGVIESAKTNKKFVIGIDADQNTLAPNNVITSTMKNLDAAVEDSVSKILENKFKFGEDHMYSLSQNGVILAPYHKFDSNIPQELKDLMKKTEQELLKNKSNTMK